MASRTALQTPAVGLRQVSKALERDGEFPN